MENLKASNDDTLVVEEQLGELLDWWTIDFGRNVLSFQRFRLILRRKWLCQFQGNEEDMSTLQTHYRLQLPICLALLSWVDNVLKFRVEHNRKQDHSRYMIRTCTSIEVPHDFVCKDWLRTEPGQHAGELLQTYINNIIKRYTSRVLANGLSWCVWFSVFSKAIGETVIWIRRVLSSILPCLLMEFLIEAWSASD